MPFSGGVFSLEATTNPVITGTTIASNWANLTLQDIANNGLSFAILKDGTQTVTANIPMAGFKFTGLGAGSAATDSATVAQIQSNSASYLTGVAGTNTITATATPAATLAAGQLYRFVAANTNSGATTLQIGANTAGAVQANGAALVGGEIQSGALIEVFISAIGPPVFQIVSNGLTLPFIDTLPFVHGSADATKKVKFEVDALTTATTRTITMPDSDVNLGSATSGSQAFTGSGTFTTPAGTLPTSRFKFTVTGGGGSGAGSGASASSSGGGNSGATAIYYVTGLTASLACTVTVGAAGAAPSAGINSGNAGGNSSVVVSAVTVTGNGGAGGTAAAGVGTGNSPAAATATNGTINIPGGQGAIGNYYTAAPLPSGGQGAASAWGGGGAGGPGSNNGQAGSAFGSGGGGAGGDSVSNFAGGAGKIGIVTVEWVI